jgi:hypothetical protein
MFQHLYELGLKMIQVDGLDQREQEAGDRLANYIQAKEGEGEDQNAADGRLDGSDGVAKRS